MDNVVKWVHVVGLVVYAGGFLALTRLLGHAVRFESATSREDAYRVFKRMHRFANWGGLGLMLAAGVWMLVADPWGKHYMKQAYFHFKLTCILALLVAEVLFSRRLFRLRGEGPQPGPLFFRVMHAVAGLAVVGALFAVFVVRRGGITG